MGVQTSSLSAVPFAAWLASNPPRGAQLQVIGSLMLALAQFELAASSETHMLAHAPAAALDTSDGGDWYFTAAAWIKAANNADGDVVPAVTLPPDRTTLDADVEAAFRQWLMSEPLEAFGRVATQMQAEGVPFSAHERVAAQTALRRVGVTPPGVSTRFADRNRFMLPATGPTCSPLEVFDPVLHAPPPGFQSLAVEDSVLAVGNTVFTAPVQEVSPGSVRPERPPPTLGLMLLRGPVSYTYMAPRPEFDDLPTVVLLGDYHDAASCSTACVPGDLTCASAEGTPNSFLQYLDAAFGHLRPDVFVEAWVPQHERRSRFTASELNFVDQSPMTTTVQDVLPCVLRGPDALGRPCPYRNIRAHVLDTRNMRHWSRPNDAADSRDLTFLTVVDDLRLYTPANLRAVWAYFYPGFTAVQVFRAAIAAVHDPTALFRDPVLLAHNRTSHELKQLPPVLFAALLQQAGAVVVHRLVPAMLQDTVEAWLTDPGAAAQCLVPWAERELQVVATFAPLLAHTEMDLYGLARALKVDAGGERKRLCILYVGYAHVHAMAFLLDTLYVPRVFLYSATKCLHLATPLSIMRRQQFDSARALYGEVSAEWKKAQALGRTLKEWLQWLDTREGNGGPVPTAAERDEWLAAHAVAPLDKVKFFDARDARAHLQKASHNTQAYTVIIRRMLELKDAATGAAPPEAATPRESLKKIKGMEVVTPKQRAAAAAAHSKTSQQAAKRK